MKRVVKNFVLFIASTSITGLLLLTALATTLRLTLANPEVVKSWLRDSNFYSSLVRETAASISYTQPNEEGAVSITTNDIVASAQDAFSSSNLATKSEVVIDAFYAWLKGETTSPQFSFDISNEKAIMAESLAVRVARQVSELPECPVSGRFSAQAFDIFSSDCRPAGVDLSGAFVAFQQEIFDSKDILPQTTYNGSDLSITQNGRSVPIGEAFAWAPSVYRFVMWAPLFAGVISLLMIVVLIALSSKRRKGLRRVATVLVLSGVGLILSGVLARPVFSSFNEVVGEQAIVQNVVDPLLAQINASIGRYLIIFGASYTVMALFLFAALILTRQKKQKKFTKSPEAIPELHKHLFTDDVTQIAPQSSEPIALESDTQVVSPVQNQTAEQPAIHSSEVTQETTQPGVTMPSAPVQNNVNIVVPQQIHQPDEQPIEPAQVPQDTVPQMHPTPTATPITVAQPQSAPATQSVPAPQVAPLAQRPAQAPQRPVTRRLVQG